MSQMDEIRKRLSTLRRRRRLARWGTVFSTLVLAVGWSLLVLLAIDVGLELSVAQRIAMLVLGGVAVTWACRKFAGPYLGVRETETDLALMIERQHGIDSDLVAAIQFERPEARHWGSPDLESAVVAQVSQLAPKLDLVQGQRIPEFARRGKMVGATLVVMLIIAAMFPRHLAVFASRLMLSGRHYPTDTMIEVLYVNNAKVMEWSAMSMRPRDTAAAQGKPVSFVVRGSGVMPEEGSVECVSGATRAVRTLALRRLASDELARFHRLRADGSSDESVRDLYAVELPRLVEDFHYTIRLGDAWTDPAAVTMIEIPVVKLDVGVVSPGYARESTERQTSAWQVSVLEGSEVNLSLRCLNKKQLESATIRFTVAGQTTERSFGRVDERGLDWKLATNDTPLARVTQEVRYEVQVRDADGLGLESPLRGYVQLKPDRPPTAAAMVVHRVLLPTAKPVIEFRMNDDYGIASAVLCTQIERQATKSDSDAATPLPVTRTEIPLDPRPLVGKNLPYRGQSPLDLTSLHLEKGDQLKVTLEVTDYRGELPGKSYLSEPLLLEISDEAGVLAAITAADEFSEKRLNDVIKQQLGVGGKK